MAAESVKRVPVPAGLRVAGKGLWRDVAKQWADDELTPDARERRLLADACHEADLLAVLEAELDAAQAEDRMIVRGSQGQPVAHPFVSEARASRGSIRAALSKLGFQDPDAEKVGRGGRTTSASARAAAMVRHHGRSA